jgi:hypothetical protein
MGNGVYEDTGETYPEVANRSLKTISKYASGAAIRERERLAAEEGEVSGASDIGSTEK